MNIGKLASAFRLLIVVGAILAVASASEKMIRSPLAKGDMEAYLHAARLVVGGQDIYSTPSRPIEAGGLYYIYPPLLAVLFVPFTFVAVPVAIVAWSVFNVILIGWIITKFYEGMAGLRLWDLPREACWVIVFFSLLPASRFILHHMFYGQSNILILALGVLGLKELRQNRTPSGTLSIGLSIALKVFTFPLIFWFVFRKDIKKAAGIVGGAVFATFLPALILGFSRTWSYLSFWFKNIALYGDLTGAKVPLSVNISLEAELHRFFGNSVGFTYQGRPHYLTLFRLSESMLRIAELLLPLLMLLIIAWYAYVFRKSSDLVSYWGGSALVFALASIFTPFAQKHYLVLLLPAFIYIAHIWYGLKLRDKWFRGLALGSFVLLFFTNEAFCGGLLGGIFVGTGCLAWGVLLASAAIVRAGTRLEGIESR